MTKYVLLIAATTVLVFAGLAYFFYAREQSALEKVAVAQAETVKAKNERDAALKANEVSQQTINALRDSFKVANELAADLAGDVESAQKQLGDLQDQISALREIDNEVGNYWRIPVPDGLQKLYPGTGDHRAK